MRRFIKLLRNKHDREVGLDYLPHHDIRDAAEDNTGLKTIYEGRECRVDIVAIHGDGGHYQESWTHSENQVFWLRDLLPTVVPDSRILSFGYSASKAGFVSAEEIALTMLKELLVLRRDGSAMDDRRPILFLAHSFGVLLLKGALATSSSFDEYGSIIASTCGIIFFGSPPDMNDKLQGLLSMTQSTAPKSASLIAMQTDLAWLGETESTFSEMEKKTPRDFQVIYILECAGERREGGHETGNSSLWKGDDDDEQQIKSFRIRMRKTHGMMIRFLDAEDEDFCQVRECIEQMVAKL